MLHFLPDPVKGLLSTLGITLNSIIISVPLILMSFFKLVLPFNSFIVVIDRMLISLATLWISINKANSKLFCKIDWDIRGLDQLDPNEWYLVLSNHQSWVDILALQTALNKKIPMLKFFLKKDLIWIPFLGLAWWALDFPFMKRYSKKQLRANPKLKGKDIESTKKACLKFKTTPVSIMNFVEGTRFTTQKKNAQNSPFQHLLKPKAGGIAFVMSAMGEYIHQIIDITIVYPNKIPTFWEYSCGRVKKIVVNIEVLPISESMAGDYFSDPAYKEQVFKWLNVIWKNKDKEIESLSNQ